MQQGWFWSRVLSPGQVGTGTGPAAQLDVGGVDAWRGLFLAALGPSHRGPLSVPFSFLNSVGLRSDVIFWCVF